MTVPIRLLDLGQVSPLRSQAIYHGLAEALTEDSQDTIALLCPNSPYFCVGFHQNPAEELDLSWCRQQGYPVLHRKIGGGTVFLDSRQLFYQCIFHRSRAPFDVASIYRRFLSPPVEALRRLGLDAELRGVNEIEVDGRRIAGTGGGQIGEAVVVAGNLLFDFPYEVMARAWRVPSAAFRRLAAEGLRRYLTTLGREIETPPAMDAVCDLLRECYAENLRRPVVPGRLTENEEKAVAHAETELASQALPPRRDGRPRRSLKIAGETYVRECFRRTASGSLRLTVRLRGARIDALAVSAGRWRERARAVEGRRLDAEALRRQVAEADGGRELFEALLEVSELNSVRSRS